MVSDVVLADDGADDEARQEGDEHGCSLLGKPTEGVGVGGEGLVDEVVKGVAVHGASGFS